jgi:hypothetical protein
MYNQLNPEKNVSIELDAAGRERLRGHLTGVNHLAILAKGTSAVAFSDVWEKAGKQSSIVSGQDDPATLSLSQAKTTLASACRSGVQASAYARGGDADVNRLGMLIGMAQATVKADLYVFNCRSRKLESAPLVISFNAMGVDGNQVDRSIGAGLAAKMLEIVQ